MHSYAPIDRLLKAAGFEIVNVAAIDGHVSYRFAGLIYDSNCDFGGMRFLRLRESRKSTEYCICDKNAAFHKLYHFNSAAIEL